MRSVVTLTLFTLAACQSPAPTDTAATTPSEPATSAETPASPIPPAESPAVRDAISAPFLGVWDEDDAACAESFSMSRFTISPTEISWFGGMGDVTAVRGDGDSVEADLAYTAEGSPTSEPEPTTTTLSVDNTDRLSLGLGGGREGLVRCGEGTGAGYGS